jgi:TonB-linked SusC/RagA family outer membrane protein
LNGASVLVKGTKRGIPTDVHGRAVLKGMTTVNTVLVVSFTGYVTQEVKLSNSLAVVHLQPSTSELDRVQIIAYGTESRRFSVGSVATVTAEQIEKQPVTNPLLALEGQVPGLAVNATSGVPGSSVLVQIRGQNTIMNNSSSFKPYDQPLFVIDGVPFAPQNSNINQLSNLAQGSGFNGGISQLSGLSPFNGINTADIESVSILKDADATSIYGTQGSNGVILITTKKGKSGKSIFNITANTGFNTAGREVQLMNTAQYLQLRKDAFAADNITPTTVNGGFFSPGYAPDLLIFDQNKYTDWQKIITGKTSQNTDVHATLSGGTLNNTFLVSAGYTRSDVNFPGDFADQRYTLHSNLHSNSANNRLNVDFGADISYDQNNIPGYGGAQRTLLAPNLPDLMDAQGNLLWSYKGVDLTKYQFYGYLKTFSDMHNYNFNNTLRVSYKVLPGLVISANMGYSRNTTSEHSENPDAAQNPANASATASFATNNFQTIIVEPQIEYNHTWGKGVLDALVGGTYKKNIANSTDMQGVGYANDNFLGSINGASTVYTSDGSDIYKYSAGFARLKYVYDQKYIISLTGRRDGSSNFGPGKQFGNFGSAGLDIFGRKSLQNNTPFYQLR